VDARLVKGPLVFVDDLATAELSDQDRHHLLRVLRIRAGDEIVVSDGRGRWQGAVFGPTLAMTGDAVTVDRNEPEITVVFAPVKGDRPEWTVAKLTELGVDRIMAMTTDRSVVRWTADHDLGRLRRVVRESAMQCRRPWLPVLEAPVSFNHAVSLAGACVADFDGGEPSLGHPVVLIGPEGGWSDEERAAAPATMSLGPTVLRAETAAVVAATLLCSCRWRRVTGA
jgi:16S rRNA (uracil1498-N3)-methyltransferase